MTLPAGEPVLYAENGRHGMLYLPAGDASSRILLVPPLFEEKRCAHRALTTCARALADAGAAVLIPDLTGTGNSGGSLAEIGLAQWLDDLRAADAFLRARTDADLILIGCRAGALLAFQVALELDAFPLHIWQPVLSGKSYLRQLRTRRMIQDSITGEAPPVGPREVEGVELSETLYADLEALALPETQPETLAVFLLQCSFNTTLLTEYQRLADRWPTLHTHPIVTEPFWNPHSPGDYADLVAALVEEVMGGEVVE